MKPPPKTAIPQASDEDTLQTRAEEWGWYLYGITTRQTATALTGNLAMDTGEPLLVLEQGKLATITRPVPLAEFSAEALQARAHDLAWLEAMVREHNLIVARIHQAGAVLPVKFGAVYPNSEALQGALAETHDTLLAQLQRLEDCDEWGVRLFADRQAMQRLADAHPALQQRKVELGAASPARAYLLKRKLADEMAAITEDALRDLARASYDRLARHALASQISPRSQKAADGTGEREALHATFLVQRAHIERFLEEAQHLEAEQDGLRCACSGPWPPYSFAELSGEETP